MDTNVVFFISVGFAIFFVLWFGLGMNEMFGLDIMLGFKKLFSEKYRFPLIEWEREYSIEALGTINYKIKNMLDWKVKLEGRFGNWYSNIVGNNDFRNQDNFEDWLTKEMLNDFYKLSNKIKNVCWNQDNPHEWKAEVLIGYKSFNFRIIRDIGSGEWSLNFLNLTFRYKSAKLAKEDLENRLIAIISQLSKLKRTVILEKTNEV